MLDASTKFREYWVSKFSTVLFTDRQTRTALVEVITVINWENVYAQRHVTKPHSVQLTVWCST